MKSVLLHHLPCHEKVKTPILVTTIINPYKFQDQMLSERFSIKSKALPTNIHNDARVIS
jgi:hypothetical protein